MTERSTALAAPTLLTEAHLSLYILIRTMQQNGRPLVMSLSIRPIAPDDKAQWIMLWQGYQAFYKVNIPQVATDTTWDRFFNDMEPMHALVAEEDGQLVGLVHTIFHRHTWMVESICYLQDLFTAETARGRGIGRKLIEAVYEQARKEKCRCVYWNTHETNAQAMLLYNKVAEKTGFLKYRKQL